MQARFPLHRALRRFWPLVVLVGIILFPFGWLGELMPVVDRMLGAMFPDVNAHAVGHTSLFFFLGFVLLLIFPQLRLHPWRYITLLLIVGIGQEAFQLAYKQRPLAFDDFRDLITDMVGGLCALLMVMVIQRWYRRRA